MDSIDMAYDMTMEILKNYPALDGIICCNMSNPVGAARAVTEMNSSTVIVGMDHDQEALRYLRDGMIYCLGVQDCYSIGFDTLQITVKTFIFTAVIGGALLITFLIANTIVSYRKTISATDEAVSEVSSFYLEAMADRRARTIMNLIDNNFDQMEKALAFIKDEHIGSQEDLRVVPGRVRTLLSLKRFAVVDKDNIVYTQYTTYTGGSRHAFLAEDMMEERDISTVSIYGSSKQLCLAIQTPGLKIMGKDFKACFMQIDITEIVDLLAFEDEGRTYFALYAPNGENLSGTELGPSVSELNLLEAVKGYISEDEWKQKHDSFQAGRKAA